jgi:hypothetical protein
MKPDELERRLRERLDALGPARRAELLHVVMIPDFERADRIGEFWGNPENQGVRGVDGRTWRRTSTPRRWSGNYCERWS